jgi:Rps23 Pro-64 3,4-dihydroxylase Tpa1-like proline 4-hydroxylase
MRSLESLRVLPNSSLEIVVDDAKVVLPPDRFQLLLNFAAPSTISAVRELVMDADDALLEAIIGELAQHGLLERVDSAARPPPGSLVDYLSDAVASDEALAAIGHHLARGDCVLLRDAFKTEFAEGMYAALDQYADWHLDQDLSNPVFSHRYHRIPQRALYPSEVQRCVDIFDSDETKKTMSRLSNRDCHGDVALAANLYLPGDYALPHSDATARRSVTFVWYLTKAWDPLWGGQLHWCPTWQIVQPTFNSLLLFDVSETTRHYVAHVRPTARGRRYTLSGWWQARSEIGAREPLEASRPLGEAKRGSVPGLTVL